jgi:hypothetical protein
MAARPSRTPASCPIAFFSGSGVVDFAEVAAEYFHSHRDGWEAAWPLSMVVVDDAGTEHRMTVEREATPVFVAMRDE